MGPIDEYVNQHRAAFGTTEDARAAAFVALLSGSRGGRMVILMAAMETVAPLSSASGYAGADGRPTTIKMFLKPIAIRANGGQSLDRQPFLCLNRYNIRLTEMHLGRIGGYFHITTVEAFPSILADGFKAGIDLSERGTGRSDIHLLIAHPFPKDLLRTKESTKCGAKDTHR